MRSLRAKLADAQQRVFINQQRLEQERQEVDWSQEEMSQWLQAAAQKEEDAMTVERYRRADEARVKELGLAIERLAESKAKTESELYKEATETQALQIQLGRAKEEYQREGEDQHRLFEQWDAGIALMAERNKVLVELGTQKAETRKHKGELERKLAAAKRQLARV